MVKLRLRREGKKKYPIYKVVAADIRSPRNGRFIEAVGQYNPNTNPATVNLKENRIEHWLRKGALPTDTVRSILRRSGFWLRWTLARQGKDETVVKSVMERWQMQQTDKLKREADRKARRSERKKKEPKKEAAPAATAAAPPAPEAPASAAS
ncbi:MAG: 30S ribosomal protein S16 [Ignavibacteriales bacterium]|nr:30S ribosomal protein S16 [Ignavibacteriales bacterium]